MSHLFVAWQEQKLEGYAQSGGAVDFSCLVPGQGELRGGVWAVILGLMSCLHRQLAHLHTYFEVSTIWETTTYVHSRQLVSRQLLCSIPRFRNDNITDSPQRTYLSYVLLLL